MVIDLHSHYFPLEALRRFNDSPVEVEQLTESEYRITSGSQRVPVDNRLFDLDLQLRDMHRQGIDRRVLMIPPFCLLYELPVQAGVTWARSLNDAVTEEVSRQPEALIGFATVPLQDVGAAVSELEYSVTENGMKGVQIATSINGAGLDDPELNPFWAECEKLGVIVLIHPHYVSGEASMGGFHLRNLIGNPAETALAGARLLFSGVLERFPNLSIVLSHGGGALPHLKGRLAHGFSVRPECRERATAPIESLSKLYFDTIVFDPAVLRHVVEHVGASQVVLGTDYPFDMAEDDPIGFVKRSGLSTTDQNTILSLGSNLIEAAEIREGEQSKT